MAGERWPRARVEPVVQRLTLQLEGQWIEHTWAGSWRRGDEEVGDLDLVVRGVPADEVFQGDWIVRLSGGPSRAHYSYHGVQVDVWTYDSAKQEGAMLLFATGPGRLNIILRAQAARRGLLLNQYGLWREDSQIDDGTEESILEALGFDEKGLSDPAARNRYR